MRTSMNFMKQLLKAILALMGLSLTRLPRTASPEEITIAPVQVGKYNIVMRQNTDLSRAYTTNPHYGSALGRLGLAVAQKYAGLHVIDVGANVGDSLAIIKSVMDTPVLCIEGDEQAFALLQQNIVQFHSVTPKQNFLGETTEIISATLDKQGWNGTILPSPQNVTKSSPMQITSLDDLLKNDPNLEQYHLLKIDAEGFDCRIIRGSSNLIERVKPVITFEYNRDNMKPLGEKGLDTLWMLKEMGYNIILFYDPLGRFILATTLDAKELIDDLHHYADCKNGFIHYYDLCLFHRNDDDIAFKFVRSERHRVTNIEVESVWV